MDEIITLDYGSGGKKTSRLIEQTIVPAMDNPMLAELGDGAILPGGETLVFSTAARSMTWPCAAGNPNI